MTRPRPPHGFGPELRVRRKGEFSRALGSGVKVRDGLLKLVAARAATGKATRLGMAVSRHVGGSVERNRARRRLREAFRLVRPLLPEGLDLIVTPLDRKQEPRFAALQASLLALARKAAARLEAAERERTEPRAP